MTQTIVIRRAFDAHAHFRDGSQMRSVVSHTAAQCASVVVMPNLNPPLTTVPMANAYRARIVSALSTDLPGAVQPTFRPYMTLYLTDNTSVQDVQDVAHSEYVIAFKYYPPHGTTNSEHGLTDWKKAIPVLKEMEQLGVVLCVHGETIKSKIFGVNKPIGRLQREAVFMAEEAKWLVETFPNLKIVFEHITTKEAVKFVESCGDNVAATITAHHLLITTNEVLETSHNLCMPVAKSEEDRLELLRAATSGNKKFFMGTDTAPHPTAAKNTAEGCFGCYTALTALELYATAFEEVGKLSALNDFTSTFGCSFYGIPISEDMITLIRKPMMIPKELPYGDGQTLTPFFVGKEIPWSVET